MKWMFAFVAIFSFFILKSQETVKMVSASMEAKTLKNKEYITVKGEVYFDGVSGKLVSYFYKPMEQITITNFNGEYTQYIHAKNAVIQKMNPELSSKNSIFYYFLNGKTSDLDLTSNGFKLTKTKNDNGLVVTTWVPGKTTATEAGKIELVHENKLPIYMGVYDKKNKLSEKIYYDNYITLNGVKWPQSITEISYESPNDSVITKRTYSNFKFNKEVDKKHFGFKFPSNAKPINE